MQSGTPSVAINGTQCHVAYLMREVIREDISGHQRGHQRSPEDIVAAAYLEVDGREERRPERRHPMRRPERLLLDARRGGETHHAGRPDGCLRQCEEGELSAARYDARRWLDDGQPEARRSLLRVAGGLAPVAGGAPW